MTIQLSQTLRPLRQKAGLTQSALAEALGVSDRAVSRWETGAALPDLSLLPRLAMLLHVSVDALLGVDSLRRQSAIDDALDLCNAAMQQADAPSAVSALRQALAAWPDEPELMVALARTLLALHTNEAAHEALALCRAADRAPAVDGKPIRLSTQFGCRQVQALALHRLGRSEEAARLVEGELPSFWVSREMLYPRVAPPEKAEGQRQFNLLWLADHIYFTLREMAKAQPDQAITLLERAVRIYREAAGDDAGLYEERICQAETALARLHAGAGDMPAALDALHRAIHAAEAFARHDGRYAAPWLASAHGSPTTPQQADALFHHIRSLLAEPAFAPLREEPRFTTLAAQLNHPCIRQES